MSKIGHGYGSEWHLLRYLGYHRENLSLRVLNITGGNSLDWLDFPFSRKSKLLRLDREFVGIEFIEDVQAQQKWKSYWPQTGNSQNWDAIGRLHFDDHDEWVMVEAKAHIDEIKSNCVATHPVSKQKIFSAFERTSRAFSNQAKFPEHWFAPYYQYANRLAALSFLMKDCVPPISARLLFIYFYGDEREDAECPQREEEWLPAIHKMNNWLGIDKNCELAQRVHHLFLSVNPVSSGAGLLPKRTNLVPSASG